MCGIAGIIDPNLNADALQSVAKDMAWRIRRRGPDGEGIFVDKGAALAHRRLAIIDLAGGDQPMHSPDGRFVLVFNGEIYKLRRAATRRSLAWLALSNAVRYRGLACRADQTRTRVPSRPRRDFCLRAL